MSTQAHPLATAASFLFVPATRPERIAKALASGADAVIVDLEDAVAPQDKPAARDALAQALGALPAAERARILVRINSGGTEWFAQDLQAVSALVAQGCAGAMLPKAEDAHTLAQVHATLGSAGAIVPIIESVAGLDAIDAIAHAPGVLRLAFGHLDFQVDAGMACASDETELVPVRLAVVLASRRAALPAPIDGVTINTQDATVVRADADRSLRGGFGGKLCIHPMQPAQVNAAFAPTEAQVQSARQVLDAFEAAHGGVCVVNGRMVDAPVIHLARKTLERHAIACARSARNVD